MKLKINKRLSLNTVLGFSLLICSILNGQDYELRTYQVPTTQERISSDSLSLMGNIGSSIYHTSSSDSLKLKGGMTPILTNLFKSPPELTTFISDTIKKDGMPVIIRAIATDLNGIHGSNLFIQPGGGEPFVFPMVALDDSTFETSVPESLLTVRNFRAWVVTVDGMYYETISQYNTPSMEFGISELSMTNQFSHYPEGIKSEKWRMISWPGVLDNNALSSDDKGHRFYDWDITTNKWTTPETIEPGKAYWFKHKYSSVPLFENTESAGTAVPLVDYEIELQPGWNIIGSPFSFPVEVEYDPKEISGLYLYGQNSQDGWSSPQTTMKPWAGYAINTKISGQSITLKPFPAEIEQTDAARVTKSSWTINLLLDGEDFFDHSNRIGRQDDASEYEDGYDVPSLPHLDHFIKISMDLNQNLDFNFSSDIRSTDEFNGVWNFRLRGKGHSKPVVVNSNITSSLPSMLVVKVVDIPNRTCYDQFLMSGITVNEKLTEGYDMKLIAGDQDYVEETVQKILSEIPEDFSLSQNYPNPFNPLTKIDFTLPRSGDVSIVIYNLKGQQVKTLVAEKMKYGFHTITWNGLDQFGRSVSSGVYFSEMRARGFRQTKKMLLLK